MTYSRNHQHDDGDADGGQKPAGVPADDEARERRDEVLRGLAEEEGAAVRGERAEPAS